MKRLCGRSRSEPGSMDAVQRRNTGKSSLQPLRAPAGAALPKFSRRCPMSARMQISNAWTPARKPQVYLIDTNVVSETRKKERANPGVVSFFDEVFASGQRAYLSVISVGELRRGVEIVRHRGETDQASLLEAWLATILDQYGENILSFEADAAQ